MGFYSWNCACCGKSIRNEHTAENHGIVMVADGKMWSANSYDGYGRFGDVMLAIDTSKDQRPWFFHVYAWDGSMNHYPENSEKILADSVQPRMFHQHCWQNKVGFDAIDSEAGEVDFSRIEKLYPVSIDAADQGYW